MRTSQTVALGMVMSILAVAPCHAQNTGNGGQVGVGQNNGNIIINPPRTAAEERLADERAEQQRQDALRRQASQPQCERQTYLDGSSAVVCW
jgi:phosphoenolpyruvate-protein kinase (PTS system EI component)